MIAQTVEKESKEGGEVRAKTSCSAGCRHVPSPIMLNAVTNPITNKVIGNTGKETFNLTPWSESTSELYRPSDHRLSAK
jgi:hypothetical protein